MTEGALSGGSVPGYNWLNTSELPHKYLREEYLSVETDNSGSEAGPSGRFAKNVLPWLIGGTALLLCGAAAGMIVFKKKHKK